MWEHIIEVKCTWFRTTWYKYASYHLIIQHKGTPRRPNPRTTIYHYFFKHVLLKYDACPGKQVWKKLYNDLSLCSVTIASNMHTPYPKNYARHCGLWWWIMRCFTLHFTLTSLLVFFQQKNSKNMGKTRPLSKHTNDITTKSVGTNKRTLLHWKRRVDIIICGMKLLIPSQTSSLGMDK